MQVADVLYARVIERFFSRRDVVPFQWWSKERQIGGYAKACQHRPPWVIGKCPVKQNGTTCSKCQDFTPIPVDESLIGHHMRGAVTLGSYQLATDAVSVKWACLDFDDHGQVGEQALQDAATLARMSLKDLNLPTVMELSGGSGWRCHLWTFFSLPVPAIKARVVLDAALRQCGLHESSFIERFPKQSRALNGYGNLVKIPFGVHRKTGNRSVFLNEKGEPVPSVEAALDQIEPVDPIVLDATIDLRHLSLEEVPIGQVQPAKNFDHPIETMNRILSRCWYFREVERQQMADNCKVHYEDWWNYVLMFSRFGEAGAHRVLAFSRLDDRHDEDYTVNIINYVRQHGYHAPSCRRLRDGPGQVRCPLDPLECGAA